MAESAQSSVRTGWRASRGLPLVLVILIAGCGTTREGRIADETGTGEAEIVADAYSFNARIWRDGKPTTFKLELYCTDTLIGIAARGYLGKGAFKGWMDADSTKIYFPSSNELLYEAMDDLVETSDCGVSVAGLGFLELFGRTPDSLAPPAGVKIESDWASPQKPKFRMASEMSDCPWVLELDYDRQDGRWAPFRLSFDNGRGLVLKATRDRYRARIGIPLKRFRVDVPADAIRTIP